jgi:hypothetical protein
VTSENRRSLHVFQDDNDETSLDGDVIILYGVLLGA